MSIYSRQWSIFIFCNTTLTQRMNRRSLETFEENEPPFIYQGVCVLQATHCYGRSTEFCVLQATQCYGRSTEFCVLQATQCYGRSTEVCVLQATQCYGRSTEVCVLQATQCYGRSIEVLHADRFWRNVCHFFY